jgi:predicted ATPase
MHICNLSIGSLNPLEGFSLDFSEGVTVIRGSNGLGKTLILEALSLLGHVPVLQFTLLKKTQPLIQLSVEFNECDYLFLDSLFQSTDSDQLSDDGRRWQVQCQAIAQYKPFWEISALQGAARAANRYRGSGGKPHSKRMKSDSKRSHADSHLFKVGFDLLPNEDLENRDRESYGFLKECLSNEHNEKTTDKDPLTSLQKNWTVLCSCEDEYLLLGLLQSVNRPALIAGSEPESWHRTVRTTMLDEEADGSSQTERAKPGIVAYINTDMYEWGTGLDLRESPKHLRDDLTRVVVRRLQLTNLQESSPKRKYGLRNFEEIGNYWEEIFKHQGTPKITSVTFSPDNKAEPWIVKIAHRQSDFSSSGENQVFFLLAMTAGLQPQGSCLLLDEPELHLSFTASKRLFEYFLELAKRLDCQIVIVTHSLFHANQQPSADINFVYLERTTIEGVSQTVPLEGKKAFAKFAKMAHSDIKDTLLPMMLPRSSVELRWGHVGKLLFPDHMRDWGLKMIKSLARRLRRLVPFGMAQKRQ